MNAWLELDHKILRAVNGLAPNWDYVLGWPTYLGWGWMTLFLACAAILIWDRASSARYWKIAAIATAALLAEGSTRLIKDLVGRSRPFEALKDPAVRVLFNPPDSFSFPSGHAATAFAFAVLLNRLYPKARLIWLYPVAAWICLTRLYVGAHFLTDVAAGALIGALVGEISFQIWKKKTVLGSK